ncbi:hypothetical protein DFQ28_009765 [Apophysomyces sp. BC1034]|nr:hypothetical protein DFQ30_001741 [Apophysomyces sp. BC1015]KAG0181402.1 hypothetical protein DFQ29_008369 [Apophysomyces sp. BC1021]KAG0194557.1 hypothetical protein DFQ28_009765 [Apophysomyces sp. BC1034]
MAFYGGERPQEDGIIRYGDHVSLKHNQTGRFLTSNNDNYEGGSGQNIVFAGGWSADEWSTFIVIPPRYTEEEPGYEVGWDDEVRLKHVPTRRNLHSHPDHESPVTGQQEVTCFGDDETSDENDIWVVAKWDEDSDEYDDFWRVGQGFVLRHLLTGRTLHSHEELFFDENNEVTCFSELDENDMWRVEY